MNSVIRKLAIPLSTQRSGPRSVHFSSATAEWETPRACSTSLTASSAASRSIRAPLPRTPNAPGISRAKTTGLSRDWTGKVFMNPPYGREIGKWVKKAWTESLKGALVVCLLPARVDTRWWHEYAKKGHVYFLQGRLKFGSSLNSAPFPSAIVTFGKFFSR